MIDFEQLKREKDYFCDSEDDDPKYDVCDVDYIVMDI